MSDARTDFFSSAAKASKAASRDDFFAGTYSPPEDKPAADYSKPYAYFTPEVQRQVGNDGTGARALEEIPGGFNQGVAHLLGLPVTALVDAANLSSAGMGYLQSKITGGAPSQIFDPADPASVPLTGAWNEQLLNSTPLGDVTSVRNPDSAVARVVHDAAAGVPGGLVGGGPMSPSIAAGAAGGAGGAIAGELGADPATQATVSLLAGAAGASAAERIAAKPALSANPEPTAQDLVNERMGAKSMGAAAAAPDLKRLTSQTREGIMKAAKQGGLNPEAVAHQYDADTLPVPIRLTKGEATGDADMISRERNSRAQDPERVKFYQQRNEDLIKNLDELRASVSQNVLGRDSLQHGQQMVDSYKTYDAPIVADIDAKYQALRDAAGGDWPVDAKTLHSNVMGALKKELVAHDLTPSLRSTLDEFAATGKMSFDEWLALRRNAGNVARTNPDGNARTAAGIVVHQLEALPLSGGAAELRPLAEAARNAAKARFDAMRADPAYKAAAEDSAEVGELSPLADKFMQKYVVNGKAAHVKKMRETLANDQVATETMAAGALDYLYDRSGAIKGKLTQDGYNNALRDLSPKIGFMLPSHAIETAEQLGRVAKLTMEQKAGGFENNSNTFVSAAGEHARNVAENVVNYKLGGIPGGTWIRQGLDRRAARKEWRETTAPAAGVKLDKLLEVGKKK